MSSIQSIYSESNSEHGAYQRGGKGPDENFFFSGSTNIEEIHEFKEKVILLLRFHGLEKFLYEPLEQLLPNKKKYKLEDIAEERLYDEHKERIEDRANKAYSLVKGRFKPKTEAYSVIEKAVDPRSVHELWRLFCTHYENYGSANGADMIVEAYYQKPKISEVISLFITYTQHYNRIDQIEHAINAAPDASFFSFLTPGQKNYLTPQDHSNSSGELHPVKSTFPQWARALHALHRIQQAVPTHEKLIKSFIYEHIGRKRNQDVKRITVEETLDKLKSFVLIYHKREEERQEIRSTRPMFYCQEHGNNPSHATESCRYLQRKRQFQDRGRSKFRSTSRDRFRGRSNSNHRRDFNRRSRSNSKERRPRYQRGGSPHPSYYQPQRNNSKERREIHHASVNEGEEKANAINKEAIDNDEKSDKFNNYYDYHTVIHTNIAEENFHNFNEIIGDSGASGIIFNNHHSNLVTETEPIDGSIVGAGGTQIGAIKFKGITNFMGVIMPCYIADITKSVVGIGFLTQKHGFIVEFRGEKMHLYSTLSGQRAVVQANNSFLFPLPTSLFRKTAITVMLTDIGPSDLHSLWHFRLGHIADRKLHFMATNERYTNRGLIMRGYAGRRIRVSENCDCCQESKAQKRRSTSAVPREASEIGANWHVDLLGKQAVSGLETGNKYFIIFIDRFSRYRLGFGLKSNNVESILLAVNRWYKKAVLKAKALGTANLKISLYSDNLEMKYPDIQEWCATNGIEQFFTAPGHSSSNGLVERAIGVTRNMARALLKARDLPEEFWELAMRHACFLTNRLPFDYRGSFQPDPFSAWTGHTFDYSKIRIFGSKCYVLRTDNKKDFSSKAKIGIYVGHAENSNSFLVYIPSENRVQSSENVRFQERVVDIFTEQRTPDEVDSISEALSNTNF